MADDTALVFEQLLERAVKTLKDSVLGQDFRLKPQQIQAIKRPYEKKDLVAVLPTGFGKSLVYQVLALMAKKETPALHPVILIVCPLIGIIKDQIEEAACLGLKACNLSDALGDFQVLEAKHLVFASAEAATDQRFLDFLMKSRTFANRLLACVVDESHTVCTWSGLRYLKNVHVTFISS